MASGNQNLISGSVTKDIQEIDQKHRIFSMKIRDFRWFFVHFLIHCKSGVLIFCRSKSASRGFEPTRDFGRLFTGSSRWYIPLRHGRGCGLRGCGTFMCVRTTLTREKIVFAVFFFFFFRLSPLSSFLFLLALPEPEDKFRERANHARKLVRT